MVAYLYGPVHGFMLWNLSLAAVPAVLALVLFAIPQHRGVCWWVGLATWLLFLPNAPYVLTDVVHMIHDIQRSHTDRWSYVVIATYGVLFACGLASYALSLDLFRRYLHRTVASQLVVPTILSVHALCVVAMYLGRVVRLNSWDALIAPREVVAAVLRVPRPATVGVIGMMFVVVGAGVFATVAVGHKLVAQARCRA
ncbi:MAG TPA: DUF1361 domain-containing protein [Acidimicrobiia bacterium]|nr:DUF1361 domain-containing protein [Acidimicrobiia bacterium]